MINIWWEIDFIFLDIFISHKPQKFRQKKKFSCIYEFIIHVYELIIYYLIESVQHVRSDERPFDCSVMNCITVCAGGITYLGWKLIILRPAEDVALDKATPS